MSLGTRASYIYIYIYKCIYIYGSGASAPLPPWYGPPPYPRGARPPPCGVGGGKMTIQAEFINISRRLHSKKVMDYQKHDLLRPLRFRKGEPW